METIPTFCEPQVLTRRVAVVMSRMPRLVDPAATWLQGLRAALRRIRERQQMLLVSPGTAGSDFVIRGAERIGVPTEFMQGAIEGDAPAAEPSIRDRHLIEQADELLVLAVRTNGNVHRLLLERLRTATQRVVLVDLPELQSPAVRESLLQLGATLWAPGAESRRPLAAGVEVPAPDDFIVKLAPLPHDDVTPYLTHTTRACPGPWPQQSREDYWDSLLDHRPDADHSALHTLRRIVMQRRLIGSGRTIRGSYPVVSFTAAPIGELSGLRCFRKHRTHWDFEPYAISIRRDVLERRGVAPAVYGGESVWGSLTETQRPYFQFCRESTDLSANLPGGTRHQDWSVEREWRHLGELDLSSLQPDEITVLVPTVEAARQLQPYCPWALTLWPGEAT